MQARQTDYNVESLYGVIIKGKRNNREYYAIIVLLNFEML